MKRKALALVLSLALVLALLVMPAGAEGLYTDVAEDAWYAEAAAFCAEAGLMDGMGDGTFGPGVATTRAMAVTVLHRLSGTPNLKSSRTFTDVAEDDWYGDSVSWAAGQGITLGRPDGSFGPNDPVTRQDLTVFLWRSMGSPAAASAEPFGDEADISDYALEAVHWARSAGIVNGMGDGTFAPKKGATRAELASMLMKLEKGLLGPSLMTETAIPCGITSDGEGGLLVTDTYNKCVWLVKDGVSTRLTGSAVPEDLPGEPLGGFVDDTLEKSLFLRPWAIVPFLDGYAVSDTANNSLRLVSEKGVETINGSAGEAGLQVSELGVTYDRPTGLASDEAGNLYVSDTGSGSIRVISSRGLVTTLLRGLDEPTGLCWYEGSLYIAETGAQRILKLTGGAVTVLAGSGEEGLVDGAAAEACFSSPMGLAVDGQGRVYVADAVNGAVRRIADGQVVTLVKAMPDRPLKSPVFPVGLLVQEDVLYICDNFTGMLMSINIG